MDTDRNLLFGVLALQAGLIDRDQFAEACTAWAAHKTAPLAEVLTQRGWITPEDRTHLEYLLSRSLARSGGSAARALAEVTTDEARRSLAGLDDDEVRRSLAAALPHTQTDHGAHVLISTIAYQPETRERYTLTRLHAQGGLGRVWLARDADLGRDVALKELRPERTDNPALWARFLEEAKITGQLEHPGIVPVYELARAARDQKPFYTMRFVRGRTLNEAARAYHQERAEGQASALDFQALLNAFISVCQAVAYAHSRGVIHRDLKGQNVVLGDFGEVIVLDWGLAKLVDRPEQTLTPAVSVAHDAERGETVSGQALGTPAYMSPEQAEGLWGAVDRCSDVYGLGAILYEILTGHPPFDGDDTADVLRRVVHEAPTRPRSANPQAPAALEAVCLKALAKKPADRYASAKQLADEVRHFLADEPVSVYREPLTVRLTRWGRRHRTAAASIAVLLLSALAALSVGTVLINGERAKAEASFRQARQAVDDYFTTISESKLLTVPGLQPLRKELLERARSYYQSFIQQRGKDPGVKAELAATHYRVGWITLVVGPKDRAADPFRQALALYDELIRVRPGVERHQTDRAIVLNDLGNALSSTGRTDEALRIHREALAVRERLAKAHPDEGRYQNELAKSHANIGGLLFEMGHPDEALASYEAARALNERAAQMPAANLAGFLTDLGRNFSTPQAVRLDLAIDFRSIGHIHYRLGRTADAIRAFEEARALFEALAREQPENIEPRSHLAGVLMMRGFIEGIDGRHDESLQTYQRALAIVEPLAAENPAVANFRAQLASAHREIGRGLRRARRYAEARRHLDTALALQEKLVRDEPDIEDYARTLAYIYREAGWIDRLEGRPAEALRRFQQARAIDEKQSATSAGACYDLACDWAICIPLVGWGKDDAALTDAERSERQRLGDEAMKALKSASARGWRSVDHMAKDEDLDALRHRSDFQALMAELRGQPSSSLSD
jgi:serine/threonine-protein kinase